MRRYLFFISVGMLLTSIASCGGDDDKTIKLSELPTVAQTFISTHFADLQVATIKKDNDLFDKSYEVKFTNGCEIDFDGNGNWTSVDCLLERVPDGIIPEKILNYVNENYANNFIVEIEKESRGYEIKLNSNAEINFDTNFNVINYDN